MSTNKRIKHFSINMVIMAISFVIGFGFTFIHDSRQAFYDHYSFSLELLKLEKLIMYDNNEEKVAERLELLISFNDNNKLSLNGGTKHEI